MAKPTSKSQTQTLDLAGLAGSWDIHLAAAGRSVATRDTYGRAVRGFVAWCLATDTPLSVDRRTVERYLSALRESGAEPGTVLIRYKCLRAFSKWLGAEGEIPTDELVGMDAPKVPIKLVQPVDNAGIDKLLKACAGKSFVDIRDTAIIRLMIETGLRAGEVVALTVHDVDPKSGWVQIHRAKNGKGRKVWFGPRTAAAIERYLRQRSRHRLADTDALWLSWTGTNKLLSYHGLHTALCKRARAAGLDNFHPHLLRHTFATRWLTAGGSEGGAMAMAGWSNRSQMDRYSRATSESRAAEEAKRLALGDF
jgi:integrase/recombinase XerD